MGMETDFCNDVKAILQPVLRWGARGDDTGLGWSVASYYVSGRPGHLQIGARTKAINVSSGDTLDAVITLESRNRGTFGYLCEFSGIAGSGLFIETPQEFVQTGVALEVDHVMRLSDLPMSEVTRFDAITVLLDDGTKAYPVWQITNPALEYNVRAIPDKYCQHGTPDVPRRMTAPWRSAKDTDCCANVGHAIPT
jgi:hypothetical protein